MCRERKYQYYEIKVINNVDMSEENITILNKKEVNKSNYKEMLKVYREIKDEYKNQNVTINFLGVSGDSTIESMYKKVYSPKIDESETIFDVCEEFNNVIQKFKSIKEQSQKLIGAYDKKQDIELHKLDNLDKKNIYELTDEEKNNLLKIAINLQSARVDRRQNKNQQALIKSFMDIKIWNKLFLLNIEIQKKKEYFKNKNQKIKKLYQENKIDNSKQYKEVPYKDFKERIRIMKELQKQFQKVTYDESKQVCLAYNKIVKTKIS